MAREQQLGEHPITYGDVFNIQGSLQQQPVTKEDASFMQTLESMALGSIPKGGAASAMQSAADRNVKKGSLTHDAHTGLPEQGLQLEQAAKPGIILQSESVAGHPVAKTVARSADVEYPAYPVLTGDAVNPSEDKPPTRITASRTGVTVEEADTSTFDSLGGIQAEMAVNKPVTIGEALEAAAVGAGDCPVEESDACAIQSAEARAAGPCPGRGSIGAEAQSAAAANAQFGTANVHITLADVLSDASVMLSADKPVTEEDAAKVADAERRWRPQGDVREGGRSRLHASCSRSERSDCSSLRRVRMFAILFALYLHT